MEYVLYYLFLLIHILLNKKLNKFILIFFLVKMVFNYRKCTISYIECKLRNVKKEDGYINKFMNDIIDFREKMKVYLYTFMYLLLFILILILIRG